MTSFAKLSVTFAAACAIGLTPVQATADTDDVAKVLAGIAVLGILAKAAENRSERKKARDTTPQEWSRYNQFETIDGELRRYGEPRQKKTHGYKKNNPLPDRCLFVLDTDRGRDRLVYGQRCLARSYKFTKKLPEQCKRLVRTDNGRRVVFGARCLQADGWKVARR